MYTVKEVAQLLDLTEHAIRFYTDQGLVPDLKRDKNNRRIFDEESLKWLIGTKNLKKCGMSIEDIKTYVALCLQGDSTIHERYEIIRKQKENALVQLEEAKLMAEFMINKEKHYLDIYQGLSPDNTNPALWEKDTIPTIHQ